MKYEFNPEDAFRFARSQGIEVKQSGKELFFKTCPYCKPRATKDNTRTFSINLETGQFSKRQSGDIIQRFCVQPGNRDRRVLSAKAPVPAAAAGKGSDCAEAAGYTIPGESGNWSAGSQAV